MIFKNHVSSLGEYHISQGRQVDYHQCCIVVGSEEGQMTASYGEVCGPKGHSGKMAYTDFLGQGQFPPLLSR